MFSRILVANRGEIAVRIARTCRDLGVESVAVFSDADRGAWHARACDAAVSLPGVAPAETYLCGPALVDAALASGAEAVHPGYGFLAESAHFAAEVGAAGLAWIGPPPEAIAACGDKVRARALAAAAGVPAVPGSDGAVGSAAEARSWAARAGYPVAIKAAAGGGGRGLRIARDADEVADAWGGARREAAAYFGADDVYVERYLEAPRHLEVQVLASGAEVLSLGVRDCSLQRRHQKLVEETPPAGPARAEEMGNAAAAVARACGYAGAGTVEFLAEADGTFYFLEVNARLQVEHTVTEEVFGVDLVAAQLHIAAGEPPPFAREDAAARGHALECRINAEDPERGFAPSPGRLRRFRAPAGPGVRVDSGYREGDEVPRAYDSLVCKVVTLGATREAARRRMLRALAEFEVEGVATTIPAHLRLLEAPEFVAGGHTTRTADAVLRDAASARPAHEPSRGRTTLVEGRPVRLWHPALGGGDGPAAAGGDVVAPIAGTVLAVLVDPGQEVAAREVVAVIEAMKMETSLEAPVAGRVADVAVATGEAIEAGRLVVRIA